MTWGPHSGAPRRAAGEAGDAGKQSRAAGCQGWAGVTFPLDVKMNDGLPAGCLGCRGTRLSDGHQGRTCWERGSVLLQCGGAGVHAPGSGGAAPAPGMVTPGLTARTPGRGDGQTRSLGHAGDGQQSVGTHMGLDPGALAGPRSREEPVSVMLSPPCPPARGEHLGFQAHIRGSVQQLESSFPLSFMLSQAVSLPRSSVGALAQPLRAGPLLGTGPLQRGPSSDQTAGLDLTLYGRPQERA